MLRMGMLSKEALPPNDYTEAEPQAIHPLPEARNEKQINNDRTKAARAKNLVEHWLVTFASTPSEFIPFVLVDCSGLPYQFRIVETVHSE